MASTATTTGATMPPLPPWMPIVLLLAGSAAYASGFCGVFLFDDKQNINASLGDRPLFDLSGNRPLLHATLSVNYRWGREHPFGYHVVNVGIHLAAGLALFGVVRRLSQRNGLALVIALLWLVHPLQTQSVTYIIQRGESMMGLFYLLTLYGLIRCADPSSRLSRFGWGLLAGACCCAGMLTKEVMVTAPVVAISMDRIYLAGSWARVFRQRGILHAGLFASLGLLMTPLRSALQQDAAAAAQAGAGLALADSQLGLTSLSYALTQPGVVLHYLRLVVWPYPLCADYHWPIAQGAGEIGPPLVFMLALLASTVWALGRHPRIGLIAGCFFLILAPTSSVLPIADLAVEHRMYLPLAAAITLGVLAGELGLRATAKKLAWDDAKRRRRSAALVVVVASALASLTFLRNFDYQDEVVFWHRVIEVAPHNARAHLGVGTALLRAEQFGPAEVFLAKAIQLDPTWAVPRYVLGSHYLQQQRLAEAEASLRRAIDCDAGNAGAYSNLGMTLARAGKLGDAIHCWEKALELPHERVHNSGTPIALAIHNNLGVALMKLNQSDRALAHFRKAQQLDPSNRHRAFGADAHPDNDE